MNRDQVTSNTMYILISVVSGNVKRGIVPPDTFEVQLLRIKVGDFNDYVAYAKSMVTVFVYFNLFFILFFQFTLSMI